MPRDIDEWIRVSNEESTLGEVVNSLSEQNTWIKKKELREVLDVLYIDARTRPLLEGVVTGKYAGKKAETVLRLHEVDHAYAKRIKRCLNNYGLDFFDGLDYSKAIFPQLRERLNQPMTPACEQVQEEADYMERIYYLMVPARREVKMGAAAEVFLDFATEVSDGLLDSSGRAEFADLLGDVDGKPFYRLVASKMPQGAQSERFIDELRGLLRVSGVPDSKRLEQLYHKHVR